MPDDPALQEQIRAHLARYPALTAGEVARALRANRSRVRRELAAMAAAGQAATSAGTRTATDHRPTIRWTLP